MSIEKHPINKVDYQRLMEQWNKDLEGIDFSLEPFLKKCKQEQEERQKQLQENTKQFLIMGGDSTLFNQPIQAVNCHYSLYTTSYTSNTSNVQAQNI
ncbi:hypothetical protein ABK040_006040 [Willaertia magna]